MKQSQVVATVKERRARAVAALAEATKLAQKPDNFSGFTKTYRPLREDELALPPEAKRPVTSVATLIAAISPLFITALDTVRTQDQANMEAQADVTCGGLVLTSVPATHLLFLEGRLKELLAFVSAIPTLDPAENWRKDEATGQFRSDTTKSQRTRKVQKPLVMYPATEQHPAQTQLITEDIPVGEWEGVKFSGAIPEEQKKKYVDRITRLMEAVVEAREAANNIDAPERKEGDEVLKFIFAD